MNLNNYNQEALLQQAQHIWSMLDDMSEKDPEKYKQFIDRQMKEGKEHMVPPTPHMCVKTTLLEPYKKRFYINFCEWKTVPPPKSTQDPVPLLGSQLDVLEDDNGAFCLVSVSVNPDILQKYGRETHYPSDRETLINLAIDFIHCQIKVKLSRNYELLEGDSHKGDLKFIQNSLMKRKHGAETSVDNMSRLHKFFGDKGASSESLLSQLSNIAVSNDLATPDSSNSFGSDIKISLDSNSKKNCLIEEISSQERTYPRPEYEMKISKKHDQTKEIVTLKISLPNVASVSECDLDVSEDDLSLTVPEKYSLNVRLPRIVDENTAKAKFNKTASLLTVTVCVK